MREVGKAENLQALLYKSLSPDKDAQKNLSPHYEMLRR